MKTLDEILEMWAKDSIIDPFKLDDTTIINARLHSKYLQLFTKIKLTHKKKKTELDSLMKSKWLYYSGKLGKDDMDKFNWPYDPYDGHKQPLKSDMDYYYKADKDIQKINDIIEYYKVIIDTLDEIIQTIKWRHQSINNIIKWRQFEAGN